MISTSYLFENIERLKHAGKTAGVVGGVLAGYNLAIGADPFTGYGHSTRPEGRGFPAKEIGEKPGFHALRSALLSGGITYALNPAQKAALHQQQQQPNFKKN